MGRSDRGTPPPSMRDRPEHIAKHLERTTIAASGSIAMHQQPRLPPRVTSPTASPNPNSQSRAATAPGPSRPRAESNTSVREAAVSSPAENSPSLGGPPADSIKKLDQIVQNFFNKVAVLVLDARIKVQPVRNSNGLRKTNKWFQIETDEINDFRDALRTWRLSGSLENRPPPLILEVYLDTSCLKDSQSLTIIDDDGKRWDVMEQLSFSDSSAASNSPTGQERSGEVILERWKVELKPSSNITSEDFGPILPTIYKKAIVFFRSLFATTRLLPAWKFASHSATRNPHPALTCRCRIRTSEPRRDGPDLLRHPIDGRPDPVTDYVFGDLEVPVGRLSTSVTYRNDCSFRVDDSETLLSSRFMGVDENFFKPSMPQRMERPRSQAAEVGSLRDHRPKTNLGDLHQTYGSLSTFHGDGALGTSPLTALKAVKPPGSDTSSPPASYPMHSDIEPPHSLPVSSRVPPIRPTVRTEEGTGRRPSVSFQPFKAGSLSGSPIPRPADSESPASPHSLNRPSGPPSLQQPRNRTSLTAGMPASLRGGPPPPSSEQLAGTSPRPSSTSRYSSSFTHRRGRLSIGSTSRQVDDEQTSSGKQSLASSVAQPGSGIIAEPGTSSGSFQEEDNISEFLKALDSKRTLKSFETTKRGDSATNKTVAQLSKFHQMRESNNALTESMTSSMQMHRSSSSSSRQLASVPGMLPPASMSASSSPGKPHSPHTPHTPAIPSRLSANSIVDSAAQGRPPLRQARPSEAMVPEASRESTITQEGTTAIDIPLSPRLLPYQRRSSSVAQQSRALIDDDDADVPFAANRSLSLGADDREPPTISGLLGRQLEQEAAAAAAADAEEPPLDGLQATDDIQPRVTSAAMPRGSSEDNPTDGFLSSIPSSSPFGRRRYTGMGAGRRQTPPHSSRGSFAGSANRPLRDDNESVSGEPLMFDLSEMDALGRRSLEEGRGYPHSSNN